MDGGAYDTYSYSDTYAESGGLVDNDPDVEDLSDPIAHTTSTSQVGGAFAHASGEALTPTGVGASVFAPESTAAASYLGTVTDGFSSSTNNASATPDFVYQDDLPAEQDGFYVGFYVAEYGGGMAVGDGAGWGGHVISRASILVNGGQVGALQVVASMGSGFGQPGDVEYTAYIDLYGEDQYTISGGSNLYVGFTIPISHGNVVTLAAQTTNSHGVETASAYGTGIAQINFHGTALAYGFPFDDYANPPADLPPITEPGDGGEVFEDGIPGDFDGDGDRDDDDRNIWLTEVLTPSTTDPSLHARPLIVTTEEDTDDGDYSFHDLSLREALILAADANHPGVDTIVFADWVDRINIGSTLTVDSSVRIVGPGADDLYIANTVGNGRVFTVSDSGSVLDVTINGMRMAGGNVVGNGGGVFNDGENLTLGAVDIEYNTASVWGGGVYSSGGTLTITASDISDNEATYVGGVAVLGGGDLSMDSSTIARNEAQYVGGLMVNGGDAFIANSTLSSNLAVNGFGGGAYFYDADAEIVHSTIAENEIQGGDGGGILALGTSSVEVSNTIIADNFLNAVQDDVGGAFESASSYNLIGVTDGSTGLVNGTSHTGVQASPQASGLGALNRYGGPTETHPLHNGSQAIDSGSNAIAAAYGLTTDQRGRDRRVDLGVDSVDIGAFEAGNAYKLRVSSMGDSSDGDFTTMTLREAVSQAPLNTGAATIYFDTSRLRGSSWTIRLGAAGEILLADPISIEGPGAKKITVDAQGIGRVFNIPSGGDASISGLTITGGDETYGGGIYNAGTLEIDAVEIAENEGSYGAGLYNVGDLIVRNSTFAENQANTLGGGLYQAGGNALLSNTTISFNRAWYAGAGINASGGSLDIRHSTIARNSTYPGLNGSGLSISSSAASVALYHTIVAENYGYDWYTQNYYAPSDISGAIDLALSSYNLIGNGGSGGLTNGVNNNKVGFASAGLTTLGYWGDADVQVRTHALLLTSEALDAGDPSITDAPETDARGYEREVYAIDIGALELAIEEDYGP